MKQAHEKSISALAAHETLLITGSSDSKVKTWLVESSDEIGTAMPVPTMCPMRQWLIVVCR